MIVRKTQIEAFDRAAEPAFRQRVKDYLREKHPSEIVRFTDAVVALREIPDAKLDALLERGIARARSHGLTWESTLNAFVTMMVTVAPNFDQQRVVRAALADKDRPSNFRTKELDQRVSQADWKRARAAYDPAAWQTRLAGK